MASVSDLDGDNIASASVSVGAGFHAGDRLSATTNGTAITSSYNSATGVLTLSGADTAAHYQQVLDSVAFSAPVETAASYVGESGSRTLSLTASDGSASSPVQSETVAVGVVLDVSAGPAQQTIGGLTAAVLTVALGADTLIVDQTTAASFSGVIADGGAAGGTGGSLTVAGTAPLTLTSAQTYTGSTKGPAGTTVRLGSQLLKIHANATSLFSGTIADGGVHSGTGGSLLLKGLGHLTLAGTDSFTGGIQLRSGTLELDAFGAAGTGAITFGVTNTATLAIDAPALSGSGGSFSFSNHIAAFAPGDLIDLTSLTYVQGATGAGYANGDLMVSDGSSSISLTLAGLSGAQAFTALSDGHGGTLVEETSASGHSQLNAALLHHDLFGV